MEEKPFMGGLFSSTGNIDHSSTQARKVVAAFLAPVHDERGEAPSGERCNSVKLRISGNEGAISKPQWVLARPYFAMDAAKPDYGVLASWYDRTKEATGEGAKRTNIMHGPAESLRRWSGASAILGAETAAYLHSMSNKFVNGPVTLSPLGTMPANRVPPAVLPDMLWPADKHVYEVPLKALENVVEWNVDYAVKDPPFAKAGKLVLQHGSVILEPKETGAAFSTDKLKKRRGKPRQIVSIATLVPPEPFVRAMQGESSSSLEDANDETRKQRKEKQKRQNRWVVVVGGAHQVDRQGKAASPLFDHVAYEIGRALADQWPTLGKEFSGIVTASGSGLCDTVTWDEEVSRGFCDVRKAPAPVYHVRDVNQVMLEGMCCDVPFGHGVILDSPGWKDDWVGNNRDLVISVLAQDGLVIYGGLPTRPETGGDSMESAMYRYSLLPARPPLMSVIVAGASRAGENIRVDSNAVGEFMRKLDIPSDRVFSGLRRMVEKYDTFFSRENRAANAKRVRDRIPRDRDQRYADQRYADQQPAGDDDADVFFETEDDYRRDRDREMENRNGWYGGASMYAKEMTARLPIIYATTTEGVKRKRVMIDESRGYSGFSRVDRQRDGAQATDEGRREEVRVYCSNLVSDVSKRIASRKERAATDRRTDFDEY